MKEVDEAKNSDENDILTGVTRAATLCNVYWVEQLEYNWFEEWKSF